MLFLMKTFASESSFNNWKKNILDEDDHYYHYYLNYGDDEEGDVDTNANDVGNDNDDVTTAAAVLAAAYDDDEDGLLRVLFIIQWKVSTVGFQCTIHRSNFVSHTCTRARTHTYLMAATIKFLAF